MAQNDIGIDLGTTTIIIAQEGKGVVLNQPSVVAMDTRKKTVLEAGDKALAMVGRTPNYISAIFPLKDGVISDHTMTRELICRFVKQVYSSHMVKPRVAVCVPAAITGIESDAVVEAVVAAGARQVYLIDEPIAAALGSGIDITQPEGRMIIDIGGGTTDIAVLSLGGQGHQRPRGRQPLRRRDPQVRAQQVQRCHWPAHRRRTEKERGLLPPED